MDRVCWVLVNPVRPQRTAEGAVGPTEPTGTCGPLSKSFRSHQTPESRATDVVTRYGQRGAQ